MVNILKALLGKSNLLFGKEYFVISIIGKRYIMTDEKLKK